MVFYLSIHSQRLRGQRKLRPDRSQTCRDMSAWKMLIHHDDEWIIGCPYNTPGPQTLTSFPHETCFQSAGVASQVKGFGKNSKKSDDWKALLQCYPSQPRLCSPTAKLLSLSTSLTMYINYYQLMMPYVNSFRSSASFDIPQSTPRKEHLCCTSL